MPSIQVRLGARDFAGGWSITGLSLEPEGCRPTLRGPRDRAFLASGADEDIAGMMGEREGIMG